jgi:cytochrome c-type biogenesis protein CcmE
VLALACAGAIAWMLVLLQRNVVFFKTVSEAVQDAPDDRARTLRIGGGVVPQSIVRHEGGVDFELTQGGVTVRVRHTGGEPSLFKDCAPVVAEGRWTDPGTTFASTRLLIKHDNNYVPPKDPAAACPEDPIK